MLPHELDTSGPALRQFLPANGRRGIRHRLDDLLRAGVRPVFRAGTQHQVSQHHVGSHARHENGLHLHPDVLHIPEQRGERADRSSRATDDMILRGDSIL